MNIVCLIVGTYFKRFAWSLATQNINSESEIWNPAAGCGYDMRWAGNSVRAPWHWDWYIGAGSPHHITHQPRSRAPYLSLGTTISDVHCNNCNGAYVGWIWWKIQNHTFSKKMYFLKVVLYIFLVTDQFCMKWLSPKNVIFCPKNAFFLPKLQ